MSISIILWMSTVTVLLHKAQPSSVIDVDMSAQVVRVGDNVTFTCKLTGLGSNVVTLNKVVTKTDGQMLVDQIAINDQLSRVYTSLKRFSVVRTTEGNADEFILRITGVQLEDSGNYGCDVKADNLFALKVLEVYRKPENVSLYLDNKLIGNGSVITVREIQNPLNIVCRVSEVMPQPSVGILLELGMVAIMNLTKDFVVVSHLNAHCVDSTANKSCPLHLSYSMEATNRDFNVSFLHDSQKLVCISNITGFEMEKVATGVTFQVLHSPQFICAGFWNATLDMTNLEIRCRVHANPPTTSSYKHVTINEKGAMVIVNPGEDFPSYSLQDKVENEKASTMIFTIKTVTEEHFNYTYTFFANNSEGLTEKRIRIQKSLTPLVDGAEGVLKRGVMLPVVILALFTILFRQL